MNFKQLCNYEIRVEDAINNGEIGRIQVIFKGNGTSYNGLTGKRDNVLARSHKKKFDDIQVPLSEIFEALFEYKYLKPLDFTTQVS